MTRRQRTELPTMALPRRAMGAAEACRAGRPAAGVPAPSIEAQRGPIRPDPYLRPAVDRPWTAPGRQLDCCRPSRSERTVTERPARVADAPAAARVAVLIDTAHRPGCRQRESSAVVRGNPRANCTRNGVRPCPGRCRPPRITGLTPPCVTSAPNATHQRHCHRTAQGHRSDYRGHLPVETPAHPPASRLVTW